MYAASFCSGLSEWSSNQMTKSRHSRRICLTYCCCAKGGGVSRIELSMNTSTNSKGGPPVSSEEALGVCSLRCQIVGCDSCTAPGQVAKLLEVGCSVTSSANCCSVTADVVLASPLPVF